MHRIDETNRHSCQRNPDLPSTPEAGWVFLINIVGVGYLEGVVKSYTTFQLAYKVQVKQLSGSQQVRLTVNFNAPFVSKSKISVNNPSYHFFCCFIGAYQIVIHCDLVENVAIKRRVK